MKFKNLSAWTVALGLAMAGTGFVACKKDTPPAPRQDTKTTARTVPTPARTTPTAASTKVKDLVCGMTVDTRDVKHTHVHDGKTYYFCNAGCLESFKKEPAKYMTAQK